MCIEDIRIGRRSSYAAKSIIASGQVDLLCGPNSKRIAIIIAWTPSAISQGTTANANVAPAQVTLTGVNGIPVYAAVLPNGALNSYPSQSQPVFVARIEEYGLAVTDTWNGFDNTGNVGTWYVHEVFLEDDHHPQDINPNKLGAP